MFMWNFYDFLQIENGHSNGHVNGAASPKKKKGKGHPEVEEDPELVQKKQFLSKLGNIRDETNPYDISGMWNSKAGLPSVNNDSRDRWDSPVSLGKG